MVAACRAHETELEDAFVRDPFAARLAGERGTAILNALPQANMLRFGMAIRTRFVEELLLEALAARGLTRKHPAVQRGVDYLVRTQEADGSWYGRWGVAYIYGTCFALRGLAAAAEDDHEPHVQRANEWLRSIQNADGGWGESCASYDNAIYAAARSTASQTAWAVLGLMAGGDTQSSSVRNGIAYLLETQRADGGWDEDLATGTGFPKVFYLTYYYYRLSFPLLALAMFARAQQAEQ